MLAVGQVMSAAIGAAFRLAFRENTWVAAPFALSFSLLAMQLTRTVHPPGDTRNNLHASDRLLSFDFRHSIYCSICTCHIPESSCACR